MDTDKNDDCGRLFELYAVYRNYVIHEDNLANHRITWFITAQALLFGAYSFIIKDSIISSPLSYVTSSDGVIDNIKNIPYNMQVLLILILSIFGVSMAMWSRAWIRAAMLATKLLRDKWHKDILHNAEHPLLPGLTNGGSNKPLVGGWSIIVFPTLTMYIWILIAMFHSVLLRN